jgi:serine protease
VSVTAVLVTAAPSALGDDAELPEIPPAADLADEPLLVSYGWSRYSAGAAERWVAQAPAPGESIGEAYERLRRKPGVADVAFNYRYEAHGWPDDPLFESQWNLSRINAPAAWERGFGTGVRVAVLDSGVGTDGDDLACHEFVDPYNAITDVAGLLSAADDNGHGTHVTGTIAQCTNNGIGAAGVAPGATIMPVKVMDDEAQATTQTIYRGMIWAMEHEADVINLSLGMECFDPWPMCADPVIDYLAERAQESGIVVVASSGNDGSSYVSSPANHPSTIAVGGTKISDERAGYSAYGSALDLMAPGGSRYAGIWQETFDAYGVWGYYEWSGTSMAAPHVTGTVALMRSVNPAATADHVRDVLATTAEDLGEPGWDEMTGYGIVDAAAAVEGIRFNPGDPCPADTECDGAYAVDSSGMWSLRTRLPHAPDTEFYYGNPGDIAFSGDWDCNGERTPGLYRQSDGFVYLRDSNTQGIADLEFYFGNPGDIPIAGDFNGDGCDTVSVYRASEGRVYVINRLGEDGGGLGAAELDYYFGNPGDKPFVGDFDGDGIDTVGLHRESTGLVYFRNSHSEGVADSSFIFGDPGDQILAGDWNDDTIDTVAVYRPTTDTLYVKLENSQGVADHEYVIGPYAQVIRAGILSNG